MNVVICSLYTVHALYLSLSISEFMYAMDWYGVILKHDQCREAEISSRAVPKQHTKASFSLSTVPTRQVPSRRWSRLWQANCEIHTVSGQDMYKYKG
jgi:hypothetical protein